MTKNSRSLRCILNLIDDDYPYAEDLNSVVEDEKLFASTVNYAARNGLFYLFVSRLLEKGIELSDPIKALWEKEQEQVERFKKSLQLLEKISTQKGIDYVVIKVCSMVPHVPRDIDTLVRSQDRAAFIAALEEEGMVSVQSGIAETAFRGTALKIDLYTRICYVNIDFIETDFLRESAAKDWMFDVTFNSLNPEASFLLLLVHSIFGHRSLTLLDLIHLKRLKSVIDIDDCRAYAEQMKWEKAFDSALNKLTDLIEDVYSREITPEFPLLIERRFVLQCLSQVYGLKLTPIQKLLLEITLVQDRVIFITRDTPVYNFVKSIEPVRNLVNSMTAFTKSIRGDKKSLG